MVFVASRIEVCISETVRHLGQSALVTVIASFFAFARRGNRNRAWAIASLILLLLPFPALLAAQESSHAASGAAATFELATIKPSSPDAQGNSFRVTGHRFETRNTSLSDLLSFAYGLHAKQITGAPVWVETDKYDLTAESGAPGHASEMLWRTMLQTYLTECFQLQFHRDTQELPLYVLTIGTTAKLTRSKGDPNGIPALSVTLGATNPANPNLGAVAATNANMGDLARVMQRLVLEWPVVDRTGILGRYDFALNWTPDDSQFRQTRAKIPGPTGSANAPRDLFTALQEQIGLKLDLLSAPSEILIIDSVEKLPKLIGEQQGKLAEQATREMKQTPRRSHPERHRPAGTVDGD
jgi:uncharacterized protein (TIGR03435 family)